MKNLKMQQMSVSVVYRKPAVRYVPKNVNGNDANKHSVNDPNANKHPADKNNEAREGYPKLNLEGSRDTVPNVAVETTYEEVRNVIVETIFEGVPSLSPQQIEKLKRDSLVDPNPILGMVNSQLINGAEQDMVVNTTPVNVLKSVPVEKGNQLNLSEESQSRDVSFVQDSLQGSNGGHSSSDASQDRNIALNNIVTPNVTVSDSSQ